MSSTISLRRSANRTKHQGTALNEDPVKRDDSKNSVKINENGQKSQNSEFGFEDAKDCPNFDSFETEHFLAEIMKVRLFQKQFFLTFNLLLSFPKSKQIYQGFLP